jgi:hypothetical protein
MTAAQLVTLATQEARVPGMTVQAGQILNRILTELTQDYDLPIALHTSTISLIPGAPNAGTGPYSLPTDYMRLASNEAFYHINQTPYVMRQITLAEFDALINATGIANYPYNYATDVSTTPASLYVYPPPNASIDLTIRYYGTLPEIANPETSPTVPWFPCQSYLSTRLRGELMAIARNPSYVTFLTDTPAGAPGILRRWLQLQGDREATAQQIILDRRWFGSGGTRYPASKITGGI